MSNEEELFGGAGPEDFKQAGWLAQKMDREWRFDHHASRWHHWDGVRWAPDMTDNVLYTVADLVRTRLAQPPTPSEGMAKSLLKLWNVQPSRRALEALASMPAYSTDGEDWDTDPYLLGCKNGLLDLRENALVPADPSMLVTKTTGQNFRALYSPREFYERAPKFMKFLEEVTSHEDWTPDADMVTFLILWLGSSLFGFSPEQRFLLMTGSGRNGKGTLKNVVIGALGDYAKQADQNIYMRTKYGSPQSSGARADLMDLKGRRVTFFSEPEGGRFNDELLKAHTGEDYIEARGLYQSRPVRWVPTHSITFLTNDLPSVEDVGPSMGGRVMVADFLHRYEGAAQDKRLSDKLGREREGILAILAYAAQRWYESWNADEGGLTIPPRVEAQSKAFIERNDPVAQALQEALMVGKGLMGQAQLVYEAYREWFYASGEEGEPVSIVKWTSAMEKRGFKRVRKSSGSFWLGVKAKSAVDLADESDDDDE